MSWRVTDLASAARPVVFSDDEDAPAHGIPADTQRTVDQLATQLGARDHLAAHEAAKAQHARLQAKLHPPRHADYAEFSNPVHQDRGLVPSGEEPLHGSLQTYSLGV